MRLSKVWIAIIILLVAFFGFVLFGPSLSPGYGKGQMDIAQVEDADILDPARTVYPMANRVNALIFEPLLTYDDNMNLTGLLAKDWHFNEEGKYPYFEFDLKKGIEFHNGEPFTAEAVEYTLDRIRDIEGSKHVESVRNILDVEAVDDYTVRVYLTENGSDRYLLDWFASISSAIVCPSASRGDPYDLDFGTSVSPPVGTGSFKFEEWARDDRIALSRYGGYSHGPEGYSNKGPAHIESIVFHIVGEAATREAKLERGDLDFVTNVRSSKALLKKWENNSDIEVLKTSATPSLVYIGFNCSGTENHGHGVEPVGKSVPKTVRKAVAYAVNENELIDQAYAGDARRPESWLATGILSSTAYQENMYPYDPSKAREILEESGYTGYTLEIMYSGDPHYATICTLLDRWLENVGLKVTIQQLEFSTLEAKVEQKDYNAFIMGYTWHLADIIWWEWHTVRLPAPNRFWWGDKYTDAIIENTFSMKDDVAIPALKKSQRLIAEDAASIALLERVMLMAYRKDQLKNFEMPATGPSGWKFLDVKMATE